MAQAINQYSFVLFAIVGAVLLAAAMWRWHRPARPLLRAATLGIYGVGMVGVMIGAQFPQSSTDVNSYAEVQRVINNDQPTFVMLYSHFCVNCIAQLPAARALTDDFAARGQALDLIILDVHSPLGRAVRDPLGFEFTPTYIVYTAGGEEVLRGNTLPSLEQILSAVGQLHG